MFLKVCSALFVCGLTQFLAAQSSHRVDPRNLYERAYMVVPIVGSGTWADPKRPMLAPVSIKPGDRKGIIAYHFEVSDEGHFALVEFVAATTPALSSVLTQARGLTGSGAQVFERSANARAQIETAFKLLKKNFDFEKFQAVVK